MLLWEKEIMNVTLECGHNAGLNILFLDNFTYIITTPCLTLNSKTTGLYNKVLKYFNQLKMKQWPL